MIVGRWAKNNRTHEYVPRHRVKRGTSKLASIRPVIQAGSNEYQPGKRITIAIARHTKTQPPHFSIGGAGSLHLWGMVADRELTTLTNKHGNYLVVANRDMGKLLNKAGTEIAATLKTHATAEPHSLIHGLTGKVEKQGWLTTVQADDKNSRLRGTQSNYRWVPVGQEGTVKPYQHSGDLTIKVMIETHATQQNSILTRQKRTERWAPLEWAHLSEWERAPALNLESIPYRDRYLYQGVQL